MIFIEIGVVIAIFAALALLGIRENRKRSPFSLVPEREKLQELITNLEVVVDNLQDTANLINHKSKEGFDNE